MTTDVRTEASVSDDSWIPLKPRILRVRDARLIFRRTARCLMRVGTNGTAADTIARIRDEAVTSAVDTHAAWTHELILCINVLCDLRAQGWLLRVDRGKIAALAPTLGGAVDADKERIRAAHLVERDAQLRQPAVRRFIREMERRRLHNGEWHSIFSLMRDGRTLADELRRATRLPEQEREPALRQIIDPYVQPVKTDAVCEFTGLYLSEIWRYFRHTWTTTYQSTPGRKIFYLIRDRAAPYHPVIGIGALGSAIVQLSDRDHWIGWTGDKLIATMEAAPSIDWARWLDTSLRRLLSDIMVTDFLNEGIISRSAIDHPTKEVVARLTELSAAERQTHRLYPARGLHKQVSASDAVKWKQQAKTHLFRSKRALALAEVLEARRRLQEAGFTSPNVAALKQLLADDRAKKAIQMVLRRIKAAHVGIDMMDITVCGAIAPYNRLLGGKLVSLLMASPAVTSSYNRRYASASSVIASSIAGKDVRRRPHLVLLGTTSLYAVGASQYNRLKMPAEAAGGRPGFELRFIELGKTAGYGSYHFSTETMLSMDPVLRQLQRGRPVNSIFGEGVNPKLRKVRSALHVAGLPADLLLQHGTPRIVYGIPLATNFRDILIGRSRRPDYIVPNSESTGDTIAAYWCRRWLGARVGVPGVLEDVARESLAYPISHGARVTLPVLVEEEGPLFAEMRRDERDVAARPAKRAKLRSVGVETNAD